MTINLTREDFEQAIKSGASVFEGNTIPDTGKPSGRYYRFIRVPLANGEHKVDALYGQRFYGTLENKPVTFNQEIHILQSRYDDSARMILEEIKKILPAIELVGQWSIDVMRNGDDYYIIDMALAENSALNDCVPREKLRAYPQQWLPEATTENE